MNIKKTALLILGLSFLSISALVAEDRTLVGTGLCPKCALKEGGKCSNVLIVNEGGNDVKYYLTSKMKHKEFFCEGKTKGLSITGTVEEKGGKKMLAAKSIEKK